MGLKIWRKSPHRKVLKPDVIVGKNYLDDKQLGELNRVVTMYLDYTENQAERGMAMKMADWADKLDTFFAVQRV